MNLEEIKTYRTNEKFLFCESFLVELEKITIDENNINRKCAFTDFERFVDDLMHEKSPEDIIFHVGELKTNKNDKPESLGSTLLNKFMMGNKCVPMNDNKYPNAVSYSSIGHEHGCLINFSPNSINDEYRNGNLNTFWMNIKKETEYSWGKDILKFCNKSSSFVIIYDNFILKDPAYRNLNDIIDHFRYLESEVKIYVITDRGNTPNNKIKEKMESFKINTKNITIKQIGKKEHDRFIISQYVDVEISAGISGLLNDKKKATKDTKINAYSVLGDKKSREAYFGALEKMCKYLELKSDLD